MEDLTQPSEQSDKMILKPLPVWYLDETLAKGQDIDIPSLGAKISAATKRVCSQEK